MKIFKFDLTDAQRDRIIDSLGVLGRSCIINVKVCPDMRTFTGHVVTKQQTYEICEEVMDLADEQNKENRHNLIDRPWSGLKRGELN